jgi:hypothetical protein
MSLTVALFCPKVEGLKGRLNVPCAHCLAIEGTFGDQIAEQRLERMREEKIEPTTAWLVECFEEQGVRGRSVMDIGGGVGDIAMRLLQSGARSADLVEASSAFLRAARGAAAECGLQDLMAWHHGDFVELEPDLEAADVVCLDRVVCCYPNMPSLVSLSSAKANRLYGLVFPRRTWWTRLGAWAINAGLRLRRSAFRVFVHSPTAIERIVASQGMETIFRRQTAVWQAVVFRRVGT